MTQVWPGDHWIWKSWVDSANEPGCDFPLQNLPFCAFQTDGGDQHLGVGIGRFILDLSLIVEAGLLKALPPEVEKACTAPYLNALMQCGSEATSLLRQILTLLLKKGADTATAAPIKTSERMLLPRDDATFCKPVEVGNYTDFYASIHHATNVGRLFRPEQPLLPNYKFIPIGYHGRASSLVVSGTPVTRPRGQSRSTSDDLPSFGPSLQLDYELEVGGYIGIGNRLGEPVPIEDAERHLFGITLLNDWSARDIQAWEYQPLGPFLGKSFATSLSPWVVAMDALTPFRIPLAPRFPADPEPLAYLASPPGAAAAIDLKLEAHLLTPAMRQASRPAVRLSSGNCRDLYWSFAQMITHHTSNGCNLLPGDLIASGTVSGAGAGSEGSLLEITHRGSVPLRLPSGEVRSFLEDGDEVILMGYCERPGLPRIGLGECRGTIQPSLPRTQSSGTADQ